MGDLPRRALACLPVFTLAVILTILAMAWVTRDEMPAFAGIGDIGERKSVFFSWLLPVVQEENDRLAELRQPIRALKNKHEAGRELGRHEKRLLAVLAERYESPVTDLEAPDFFDELLTRVDVVPASLALAQAAWESGWGTSRFARRGYNLFGHWCHEPGCGFVPAQRPEGADHEVAAFSDPRESVRKYFRNLNSHRAYRHFRARRAELRDQALPVTGPALVASLGSYSERGTDYVEDIDRLMRANNLTLCTRNEEIDC